MTLMQIVRSLSRIGVLILLLANQCFAQFVVKGRVEGREGALTGAVVTIAGTKLGAVTDIEGKFEISTIPGGSQKLNIN